MATEDGYFLGRQLAGVDLSDHAAVRSALDAYEQPRKPHTARQVQQAYLLGKLLHHAPAPLQVLRDAVLDRTSFLQKVVGESSPGQIIGQLAAIDAAERRFTSPRGGARGDAARPDRRYFGARTGDVDLARKRGQPGIAHGGWLASLIVCSWCYRVPLA